jgi:hypothetical protein
VLLEPVQNLICNSEFGRIFCGDAAKNRAFRFNSSDLLMQILWDFRYNPLRAQGFSRY